MSFSVSVVPLADGGHLTDVLVAGVPHVTQDGLHCCSIHCVRWNDLTIDL